MNKTKISGEHQKLMQNHMVSVIEVLVVIQYSVSVVKYGYTRSVAERH